MKHSSPLDLLVLATGSGGGSIEGTLHVRSCPSCTDEVQRLRETIAPMRLADRPASRETGCLDDDAVAALAEGAPDAETRDGWLDHLAQCANCRAAVASVALALADPAVGRAAREANGRRLRSLYWLAIPAVAAALAMIMIVPRERDEAGAHRSSTITAAEVPTLLAPIGTVAEARSFDWNRVEGADRYRLTLFDASGEVRYETELAGTRLRLPDSVSLAGEEPYFWRVAARVGWDRWATSELVEFRSAREDPQR